MMVWPQMQSILLSLVVLFACSVFPDSVSADMRIFELQHRPVGELAEIVRTLLSEEAKVAAYQNTLVVNASPAELQEVARLVATYDRAKQMLRVTIEQGKSSLDAKSDIGVSGKIQDGDTRIVLGRSGERLTGSDSLIKINSSNNHLNIRASDNSYRESRQVSQFVSVLEGEPALISVGRAVPFTSQMLSYCRRHPEFIETISYQNVDTGFEILPVMYNDMVDLEIRPFMAFLDSRNPQQIVFHELSTKVRIPAGAWYELGGHMQTQDSLSREILGAGKGNAENDSSIRVRVEPQ